MKSLVKQNDITSLNVDYDGTNRHYRFIEWSVKFESNSETFQYRIILTVSQGENQPNELWIESN